MYPTIQEILSRAAALGLTLHGLAVVSGVAPAIVYRARVRGEVSDSIARRLIEGMGGSVEVETEITVTWPEGS